MRRARIFVRAKAQRRRCTRARPCARRRGCSGYWIFLRLCMRLKRSDDMAQQWTFGKKIGLGFAVTVLLGLVVAAIAVHAITSVVEIKDEVINVADVDTENMLRLRGEFDAKVSAARAYLLSRNEQHKT